MANLKELLSEYRGQVKAIEFGNRTPEAYETYNKWKAENISTFEEYGLHPDDVFDQIWDELDHLFNPRATHREVLEQWHRKNSDDLIARGIYSYEEVFYALDALTASYVSGNSNDLQKTLNKIASIPLMTSEVMQEIIYESCRGLNPNAIIGLDKVKIPMPA
jgi:hypothetical protein